MSSDLKTQTQEKIHIRIAPFGRECKEYEVPAGTEVEQALVLANKTYSPATVRMKGRTPRPTDILLDGDVITTDVRKVEVGL